MNFKVFFVILASVFLSVSCTHTPVARAPGSTPARHIIITIHGVRGTDKSFGAFHAIVKDHLEKADPNYKVLTINYTYKTGQKDYNPAKTVPTNPNCSSLNDCIEKAVGNLGPDDKISVVSYSMGGQVAMEWFLNTMRDPKYSIYAERTKNLVGLGDVFWGSTQAFAASWITGAAKLSGAIQMSEQESKSLSILSDVSLDIRQKTIEWLSDESLRRRFSPRVLSIAGIYPCYGKDEKSGPGCDGVDNKWTKWANSVVTTRIPYAGMIRRETDMVVITPSANYDFMSPAYSLDADGKMQGLKKDVVSMGFNDLSSYGLLHKFEVAEVLHADPGVGLPDVVLVPEKCIDPKSCDHGTYKYIFHALAACDSFISQCNKPTYDEIINGLSGGSWKNAVEASDKVKSDLQGFVIELRLRVPKGKSLPDLEDSNIFEYLKFHFENQDWMTQNVEWAATKFMMSKDIDGLVPYSGPIQYQVGRAGEYKARTIFVVKKSDGTKEVRIAITGRFHPGEGMNIFENPEDMKKFKERVANGGVLPFTIEFPGLKERKVEAIVRPGMSTFLDFEME